MSDRNLLVCPFILHGNSRCKNTRLNTSNTMCSEALRYLHSARTAPPPPLVHPWSDAHWPAAKPTPLISGLEHSRHSHKTCWPLFLSGGGPWQPTQTHRDRNEQVTCVAFPLLVLRGSCICCQTVWTPYSKPVQLSNLHPALIEPHRYHSSLIPPPGWAKATCLPGWEILKFPQAHSPQVTSETLTALTGLPVSSTISDSKN